MEQEHEQTIHINLSEKQQENKGKVQPFKPSKPRATRTKSTIFYPSKVATWDIALIKSLIISKPRYLIFKIMRKVMKNSIPASFPGIPLLSDGLPVFRPAANLSVNTGIILIIGV